MFYPVILPYRFEEFLKQKRPPEQSVRKKIDNKEKDSDNKSLYHKLTFLLGRINHER